MARDKMTFEIKTNPGLERIVFTGPINEHFLGATKDIMDYPKKEVVLDLGGVTYVNSVGVRCWLEFMREFSEERKITFDRCSPEFISQVNMIPDLAMGSEILSFFVAFFCEDCDREEKRLFLSSVGHDALAEKVNEQVCEECGRTMSCETDSDLCIRFLKRKEAA